MNFGNQIKNIRREKNLTQEQFAEKLNVTRQAVSNWENDHNLPDIEMLIIMADVFNLSLDDLILGGKDMNNMTEKLIEDGSETKRAKYNMISLICGFTMILIGVACLIIKGLSVEYIDQQGVLHENFFLLPLGIFFIVSGLNAFLVIGFTNIKALFKKNENIKNRKMTIIVSLVAIVVIITLFVLLIISNS